MNSPSPASGGRSAEASASRASLMLRRAWATAPSATSASQPFSAKLTRSTLAAPPPIVPCASATMRAVRRIASRITPVVTVARAITGGRSPRGVKAVTAGSVRSNPAKLET